jgi:hypothetical protein
MMADSSFTAPLQHATNTAQHGTRALSTVEYDEVQVINQYHTAQSARHTAVQCSTVQCSTVQCMLTTQDHTT